MALARVSAPAQSGGLILLLCGDTKSGGPGAPTAALVHGGNRIARHSGGVAYGWAASGSSSGTGSGVCVHGIPAERGLVDAELPSCWESTGRAMMRLEPWAGWAMKIREVMKLIERDGWFLVAVRGSHRQYKHPDKPGWVAVAGHPDDDLAAGTLNSVLKQAGLRRPKGR